MWDWIRGGSIAAAGLAVGLAVGYCLWADGGAPERGFERRYEEGERVLVKSVIDGDTVRLEDGMHVRYRGCDTPEVFRFVRDPVPGADEASARNRELVEGAWVRLRFPPPGRSPIDEYGRLLADVYLDTGESPGEMDLGTVAETLVREGLAKVNAYEMEGAPLERLRAAEGEARTAGRGVWGEETAAGVSEAPFVASRYGKYVHRPDCEYARKISPRNLMKFHTLEAGLSTKRGRCPGCLGKRTK